MSAAWDDNAMKSQGTRQVLYNDATQFAAANPNNPTFVKNGHVYYVHADGKAVGIYEGAQQHADDEVANHEGHALPAGHHTMDTGAAWTLTGDGQVENLMDHATPNGYDAGRPTAVPDHPYLEFTTHADHTPATFNQTFVTDKGA
ncbi:MAG: hypothetical protein ACYCW6_25470 [Candidatus Xenobia bacterium]